MRMNNRLMDTLEEREGNAKNEEKTEKVDIYGRELPFAGEIRRRYIQREEQLLGADLPEERERGKQMRWYRRSNRLALTWGWFIEKNCVSGTGALVAEEEVYRMINEVLSGQGVTELEDVRTAARIFLWQKSYERVRRFFPFLWELWKQLPDFLEITEQRWKSSTKGLAEEEWELLKGWLEAQKKMQGKGAKKNCPYRKMMHCLAGRLKKKIREGRMEYETVKNGICRETERVLELEADFRMDEFCRRSFLFFLFWQYVFLRGSLRGFGMREETGEWCKRLLEGMRRMLHEKDDFFQLFFNSDNFHFGLGGSNITAPVLNELYEACGKNTELELSELDHFFYPHGREGNRLPVCQRRERKFGDKDYTWFCQNDCADEVLVWMATNFHFTNNEGEDFFPVQMYLMQAASEEELFLMRGRGVFPEETLPRVLAETRQTRDFYKVPLLISWMYGE